MADFKPGSMDITQHEKTFESFMKIVVRTTIGIILFLIFLALVGT